MSVGTYKCRSALLRSSEPLGVRSVAEGLRRQRQRIDDFDLCEDLDQLRGERSFSDIELRRDLERETLAREDRESYFRDFERDLLVGVSLRLFLYCFSKNSSRFIKFFFRILSLLRDLLLFLPISKTLLVIKWGNLYATMYKPHILGLGWTLRCSESDVNESSTRIRMRSNGR